jgi:hypothetical protein
MPSTDRKLELKVKISVAQTGSQPFVYVKGLIGKVLRDKAHSGNCTNIKVYT